MDYNELLNEMTRDEEGNLRIGKIIRINSKTISVRENNDPYEGNWRIAATLLKKIG